MARNCYGPDHKPEPTNDPFDHLKLTKDHAYLGHFKKEKFLEEGHNTVGGRRAIEHPVMAARAIGRRNVREAKRAVRVAQRSGGDVNAVIAARNQVFEAKTQKRTNVAAAKLDPNAARNERAVRQSTRKTARVERKTARVERKINRLQTRLSRVKGTYSA